MGIAYTSTTKALSLKLPIAYTSATHRQFLSHFSHDRCRFDERGSIEASIRTVLGQIFFHKATATFS